VKHAPALAASLLAALLAAPGAVHADDELLPAVVIRANVRVAEHAPSAYRETVVITSSDGTTTTVRELVRGDDVRTIDESGPFHSENGIVGGKRWRQTENGVTVDDAEDPGRALPERLATTVTRDPAGALIVAALNAKGWGRKDYVDPATWRVLRRERIGATGTVTTTYDDVRDDQGRVFAHHWHVDDGAERTTSEARVTEYVPGAVSDAELARPPSRRTLVAFPDGAAPVVLPTSFDRHVFVRVTIGGRGADFILDSGASGIVVDTELVRAVGLKTYGEHSHVVAGRTTFARAIVPEMRIGPLVMRDIAAGVVPLSFVRTPRVKVAGVLGFDFLAQLGVTVDYEHERVSVVPGDSYAPPADPLTRALEARLGHGVPLVTATLDGVVAERFMLDTGGEGNFLIFDYFTRRNPDAVPDVEVPVFPGGTTLSGVGGLFATKLVVVRHFAIAGFDFRSVIGNRVIAQQTYANDVDGVMGQQMLRNFTVGFDYPHERVYLTPNAAGRKALGL
jgi:predicted aspartyl protease